MENKKLKIERIFDSPVEKVWAAWTEPEMVKKWWGPVNFSSPIVEIDFRVGGKYLLCMLGEIPGMGHTKAWNTGIYKEIVPMKKIVVEDSFSNEHGEIVSAEEYGMKGFPLKLDLTITFEEIENEKTKLTLDYPSVGTINDFTYGNMSLGWNQSFDKLAKALKGGE